MSDREATETVDPGAAVEVLTGPHAQDLVTPDMSEDPADWVQDRRKRVAVALAVILVGVGAMIMHLEIDRLIASSLNNGRSQPLGGVIGPLAFAERNDALEVWPASAMSAQVGGWLIAATVVDLFVIAAYSFGFVCGLRRANANRSRWVCLWFLLVVEAIEAVALVTYGILLMQDHDDAIPMLLTVLLAGAATAKWVLFVLLIVVLLRHRVVGRWLRATARRVVRAIWLHRLSAVLAILLFALTCLPADGVFDQLPDIQRQWIADGDGSGRHAVYAIVFVGVSYATALHFGRARTRVLLERLRLPPGEGGTLSWYIGSEQRRQERKKGGTTTTWFGLARIDFWWIAPVAIALGLAGLTLWLTGQPGVHPPSFIVAIAIPVLVILLSIFRVREPELGDPVDIVRTRARYAWLTGDVIAVIIPAIAGLGLVRSLSAPLIAQLSGTVVIDFAEGEASGPPILSTSVLFGLGVVITLGAPWLLLRRKDESPFALLDPRRSRDKRQQSTSQWWLAVAFASGVIALTLIALFPVDAASYLGAPALTVLAITLWGVVLGAFTLALQSAPPVPIFVRLRLRATPVLTLSITIPFIMSIVFASLGIDDAALHAPRAAGSKSHVVEVPEAEGNEQTPSPSAAAYLGTRIGRIAKADCTVEVNGVEIRPVLLIAAEGGGIRAAYWTASAFDALSKHGGCLADSVLLSSGVSGGSVGMALVAAREQAMESRNGEAPTIPAMLDAFATSEGVGAGVAGLLVRDQVSSIMGVRIPSQLPTRSGNPGAFEGWDRAALIEGTWLKDAPPLEAQPLWAGTRSIGIPVFNSTDARTKCKVLITPLPVDEPRVSTAAVPEGWDCVSPATAAVTLQVPKSCFEELDWAGMAMLSARFPVITPAARFTDRSCSTEDLQLIDGGYAEGSALGTVAELAPLIASRIAAFNLDDASSCDPGAPLVPVIVYLKNSAGYDLRDDLAKVSAEPLVPLVGFAAAGKQQTEQALMQRASAALRKSVGGTLPVSTLDRVADGLSGLTITIAPATSPSVAPPLGWALSEFTKQNLDSALQANFEETRRGERAGSVRALIDRLAK